MATADGRTQERIKLEIESERNELAQAVDELRAGVGEVTDISAKLRPKLPLLAAGALGGGFVLAGGIGAVARLLFRRGREGEPKAKVGRFALVDRR
jgi:hypothetical protein